MRTRTLVAGLGIALLITALGYASLGQPYLPSRAVDIFFWRIFPPALYLSWLSFIFLKSVHGRTYVQLVRERALARGNPPIVAVLLHVIVSAPLSLFLSLVLERLLVWPTYYFAMQPVDASYTVRDVNSVGNTLRKWSRVTVVDASGYSADFQWRSSDLRQKGLKAHDTLHLTGRAWLFGTYVESWRVTRPSS